MSNTPPIIGRYAPSPTGELHLGNIRTALLAWLSARSQNGQFLLRMEDLDAPRVVPGSADQILRDLEWLGLDWDGEVMYQSERLDAYQVAMDELSKQQLVYPCYCSRKEIQQASSAPHGEPAVYSGVCRHLNELQRSERAQNKAPSHRVIVSNGLQSDVGDFVIKRADGLFAYQLAVVVDDIEQGVNEVVRGADLISSTSRQCYLAQKLVPTQPVPNYLHAPLMLDSSGERMSKRDGSESLSEWRREGRSSSQLLAYLMKSVGLDFLEEQASLSEILERIDSDEIASVFI